MFCYGFIVSSCETVEDNPTDNPQPVDTEFDYDFDLVSGRYVIDAKSIMGIFSLDLSKPIDLNIHTEGGADDVLEVLKQYQV